MRQQQGQLLQPATDDATLCAKLRNDLSIVSVSHERSFISATSGLKSAA
jgi:hypothetical protein